MQRHKPGLEFPEKKNASSKLRDAKQILNDALCRVRWEEQEGSSDTENPTWQF